MARFIRKRLGEDLFQYQSFPLEYYTVEFYTFSGDPYNGYNKKLNTIMIDNSQIGSPYAMREYDL